MNETKFDGMGRIYAKYRPAYPPELIAYLRQTAGFGGNSAIADVGSGTGIFTRQLLDMGCAVYAVEPNADMRAHAAALLGAYEKFTSVAGSAEDTTLDDDSADHITAAQAFHWFDRARFKAECKRVLKPGGRVFLIWNSRDESQSLVREIDDIHRSYCERFKGGAGGTRGDENALKLTDFYENGYEAARFQHDLVYDLDGFIGRSLSASYSLKQTDGYYDAYVAALTGVFDKYSRGGAIVMPNITICFSGELK